MQNGLLDACAECEVASYRFPVEAVADMARICGLFTEAGRQIVILCSAALTDIEASGLSQAAATSSAAMVVMQDAPGSERATELGWYVLQSPFTTEALTDLVKMLRSASAAE
ncbi:MAG: hypothetical protein Q4G36_07095 [Paracoccus sp. (in: a-proteobacteria)]|nr:hypothetical protein [Paracoccus sp. (in: a-proteobacteria)]